MIDQQHIINYLKENGPTGPKALAQDLFCDDLELLRETLEEMVSAGTLSKAGTHIYRLAGDNTSHKAPRAVKATTTPPPAGLATTEPTTAPQADKQIAELKAEIASLSRINSKLTAELVSARSALRHAATEPAPAALPSLAECIYRLMSVLGDEAIGIHIRDGQAVLEVGDLRLDAGDTLAEIEQRYAALVALLPHRLAA